MTITTTTASASSTNNKRIRIPIHCIVNPASGDFNCQKQWLTVERKLQQAPGLQVVAVHMTERVGHGAELAYRIRKQHESSQENESKDNDDNNTTDVVLVVAVGGDGIAHEVASALRGSNNKSSSSSSSLVLGLLPCGTGNDMAFAHGITTVDDAIQVLQTGVDRTCGAWRVEGFPAPAQDNYPSPQSNSWDGVPVVSPDRVVRWSFNGCDAGITSAIGRSKLSRGKFIRGALKYTYLALMTIPFWKSRRVQVVTVDDDGNNKVEILRLTVFCATAGLVYGGGYCFVPNMYPTRKTGRFLITDHLGPIRLLLLMLQMMLPGLFGGPNPDPASGIWLRDGNFIQLCPIDEMTGNASDVPLASVETIMEVDGEPNLQLPATLSWHVNQIKVRGAQHVDWDKNDDEPSDEKNATKQKEE